MDERRRHPRIAATDIECRMPLSLSVQVLDISGAGILLSTSAPIEIGERALLRLTLGTSPFAARVQVRHVEPQTDRDYRTIYRVGATFLDPDPDTRRLLEQWHP